MISPEEMARAAGKASTFGSVGLGVVTATRGYNHKKDKSFFIVLDGLKKIRDEGLIEPHASLGLLGPEEFRLLKEAGLKEYNHNLETGRSYFSKICTTHTYDERIETIRNARKAGIRTCVGGIVGMGENPFHRVELAFTLRDLDVDEVPLNFLVSVDGTMLQKRSPLKPLEMLKHISVFRLILPTKNIFICAGRHHLGDLQSMIFFAGASGIMVGDFLTTKNRSVDDDIKMIRDLGFALTTRHQAGGPAASRPE
jgi:biotin synthase